MIKTHGLSHISLAVKVPDRSLQFYKSVFGVKEYYRDEDSIQVLGPGPHDVIAFERDSRKAGKSAGITHFGFRLTTPSDIEKSGERSEAGRRENSTSRRVRAGLSVCLRCRSGWI